MKPIRAFRKTANQAGFGRPQAAPTPRSGFTLLEVMLALGIFFIALFAILDLSSSSLASARRLQRIELDPSSLAAELSLTNSLEEGVESGDFAELYPGAAWTRTITEVSTNGLFQVDFRIVAPSNGPRPGPPTESTLSILLFRPESSAGIRGRLRR
jgi:general secretion pathway protein I